MKSAVLCKRCWSRLYSPKETRIETAQGESLLIYSIMEFSPFSRNLILESKYKQNPITMRILEDLLYEYDMTPLLTDPSATLVRVPTPWYRNRVRGIDFTGWIEMQIQKKYSRSSVAVLKRKNFYQSQTSLEKSSRRVNIIGAFDIPDPEKVPNFAVLIDDVATTGSTLLEAQRVLSENGSKKIMALVVARAPRL